MSLASGGMRSGIIEIINNIGRVKFLLSRAGILIIDARWVHIDIQEIPVDAKERPRGRRVFFPVRGVARDPGRFLADGGRALGLCQR